MKRHLTAASTIAGLIFLAGCAAEPLPGLEQQQSGEHTPTQQQESEPEPERFVSRQLDAIALSAADFGGQWAANEDPTTIEGGATQGGGPGGVDYEQADICLWANNWLPDPTQFYTHSWRTYTTGDGATFAQDWASAIEPETDPADLLAELRTAVEACGTTPDPLSQTGDTVTLVPDISAQLGDGSFSYRVDFADPMGVYAIGEVHTVICGQLWLHLSYVGYEAFIERDALLATMLERAAPLGGCAA